MAIYCKSFNVEKFCSFHRLIDNCENFLVRQLVWPHEAIMQSWNLEYFGDLQFSFTTTKLLSLKHNLQYTVSILNGYQCSY